MLRDIYLNLHFVDHCLYLVSSKDGILTRFLTHSRRHPLGDRHPNHQWTNAGIHSELPEFVAFHGVHLPCHRVQQVRHQLSHLLEGGHPHTIQIVSGIRLFATQAILPTDLVHGRPRSHLDRHYYYDNCGAVREEQELQVQT